MPLLLPDRIPVEADAVAGHLAPVRVLFSEMDAGYDAAARAYGFRCTGCEDNCCETLFHHHTLAEYLLLQQGFRALADAEKKDVQERAANVQRVLARAGEAGTRIMCPLNRRGLCRLYACRPMICRLHGIPHELNHPVRGTTRGPGCGAFDRQCAGKASRPLDRTPFYRKMARLENRLRDSLGFRSRLKMTIADMLLSWAPRAGETQDKPHEICRP
jgi:hypothetical protein